LMSSLKDTTISVAVNPGAMPATLIPYYASYCAQRTVIAETPAFAAE